MANQMLSRFWDILGDTLSEHYFHILGCGAIGSSVALQLARSGANHFSLYDFDKVEEPNVGVSQYTQKDIGKRKVIALRDIIKDISSDSKIETYHKAFNEMDTFGNDVVILGFDNMQSRLDAVKICTSLKRLRPKILIDGRMGSETYQQYTFVNPTLKRYKRTWYSDEEGDPEPCAAKATTYCSNIAGGFIVSSIRKLLTKQPYDREILFHIPSMMLTTK